MSELDPRVAYHKWYYDTQVWEKTHFLGVPCYKSVSDMWNYQEILSQLRPSLIVEFGTLFGGSALFFSVIGRAINPEVQVLSVDISHQRVDAKVQVDSAIHLLTRSSTDPVVATTIRQMRKSAPGKVFFIVDSDHSKAHVLAELELLRAVIEPGDYLVVEDGNVNGNPVLPGWGPGPKEAVDAYFEQYPDDYRPDLEREFKFGFTFAPSGFLVRK
ncbi:MAG: rhamnosyl O-methyltransferase [Halieaceae bacterium]|jgi:cephalosporin hydroxylase|nr:rhamnosyl O-methyltransferase [Halieaceae bacterium]